MSRRIWTKPFIKYNLSGDRDKAKSLERKARACVGYLFDQLMPNQKFRSQNWNYHDGSRITAFVWRDVLGERARVEVFAPFITGEPLEFTLTFRDGLFSVFNFWNGEVVYSPDGEKYFTQQYQLVSEEDGNFAYGEFSESEDFYRQYSTLVGASGLYPDSQVTKKAGSFSGAIRKVVQVLAGVNAPIEYRYDWGMTHGLLDTTNGKKWIIEVSPSGVYAWELPILSGKDDEFPHIVNELGYIPAPVFGLPQVADRRLLLSSSSIATAYTGSPLTSQIGWAFSYDGHECQNVVFKSGYGDDGTYQKAFRYRIDISEDVYGDPVSASITEVESEYAYSNRIQNYVRAPELTLCGPASTRILFLESSFQGPPEDRDLEFPIFVFYKNNTEQVVKYKYLFTTVQSLPEVKPYSSFNYQDCNGFPGFPIDVGDVGTFHQAVDLTQAGAVLMGVEGYGRDNYNQTVYSGTGFIASVFINGVGGPVADVFSTSAPYIYTAHDIIKKRFVYNGSFGDIEHWAIIFPFFNREAYYIQTKRFFQINGESYGSAQRIAFKDQRDTTPIGVPWFKSGGTFTGSTPGPCSADAFVEEAVYQYTGGTTIATVGSRSLECQEDTELPGLKTWTIESEVDQSVYNKCSPLLALDNPIIETITNAMELHYFNIPSPGDYKSEVVDDSSDSLFISDIVEDVSDCPSIASPLWVGNWIDVFTGNGWVSPNFRSEVQTFDKQVVGSVTQLEHYDYDDLPSDAYLSGWLGIPFTEFM